MKFLQKYLRAWRYCTGGQQLTLMAELTICNAQNTQLLEMTDAERALVEQCEQSLRERFPYLMLERQERMVETSLKLFTYARFVDEPQFLETFRSVLAVVLHTLNSSERLQARLMASGTLADRRLVQKFKFLSKDELVDYKLTETRPAGAPSVITKQRVKMYGLVLLIILCLGFYIYLNLSSEQLHNIIPTIDV
ncbi:hypothetical protein [Phascolarctobacterium sp.]|uniref:hypothetical protein n=1 Tax=Phascolarctobacterium sp. TaxID=2049039 RepID=UPI003F7EF914